MSDPRLRVTQRGDVDEEQLLAALDDPTIRVVLDGPDPPGEHQLVAEALVDLLARVFPRIDIACADGIEVAVQLPPSGAGSLGERLEQTRRHGAIDPLPVGDASFTIAIGTGATARADLWVDASGWQSYIGRVPSQLVHPAADPAAVGPLAVACRAAARTFTVVTSEVFGGATDFADRSYASALTFGASDRPLEEPAVPPAGPLQAVLVGAGSIGGAAVYTLARTSGLEGELDIVDPQTLEDHNFDRAILATREVVAAGAVKTTVAREALAALAPDLRVRGWQQTLAEFLADRPRTQTLPLTLCAVDSAGARRAVQDCLPLELINAACRQTEVQVSRHITDVGPCVYCLHMPDVMDQRTIRARLIADATKIPFMTVVALLVANPPALLDSNTIRMIEISTGRSPHALEHYEGRTLDDLWREQLLYGATNVTAGDTKAAVAAPWVTALAGVLLAGEAIKAAGGEAFAPLRLGPEVGSRGIRYAENPYADPSFAQLTRPDRYGNECLCGSPRRLRLMHERYG